MALRRDTDFDGHIRDSAHGRFLWPSTRAAMCVHCAHDLPATVYCVVHCLGSLFGTLFMDNVPELLFISKKK